MIKILKMSSSSCSDREVLGNLTDSSDTDAEEINRRRVFKERVDYLASLDSYEFQVRFRLDKESFEQLLNEIYPHLRIIGARLVSWRHLYTLKI